ncbi:hypothetical protein CDIK_2899 [Cucumispora dikerogammari]|nr:hypothetical protein CDIK_2899 [Cucumispora dikerogammari]
MLCCVDNYRLPKVIKRILLRTRLNQYCADITVEHIALSSRLLEVFKRSDTLHRTILTVILSSLLPELLMAYTIDLSEYAIENGPNKYIFTFIDSFSKITLAFSLQN